MHTSALFIALFYQFKNSMFIGIGTYLIFFPYVLGLHEKMVEKHGPRGRIIPPAPEKNLVGTTRVKISSNSTSFDGGNNLHHPNDELTTTHSELKFQK